MFHFLFLHIAVVKPVVNRIISRKQGGKTIAEASILLGVQGTFWIGIISRQKRQIPFYGRLTRISRQKKGKENDV